MGGGRLVAPSGQEQATRQRMAEMLATTPIPADQLPDHLEVYQRPQRISEIIALSRLYARILDVHGVVMEFGVRWGRHLSVFLALRTLYEPTNFYRKVIGFDTFEGFLEPAPQDGASDRVFAGSMSVGSAYQEHLAEVLTLHEAEAPMSHIRRFELCAGDAPDQLAKYLDRQPETIVALAYFDMDLYGPTRDCIELLLPHMPAGAVLAFDELMHPDFPGEAVAVKEVLNLGRHRIQRMPESPYPAFITL
ncbi:MAG TPA: class I SAM-dependent methyltransferase [Micromonosporaceae bacterium]